jgi:hypothetical protein
VWRFGSELRRGSVREELGEEARITREDGLNGREKRFRRGFCKEWKQARKRGPYSPVGTRALENESDDARGVVARQHPAREGDFVGRGGEARQRIAEPLAKEARVSIWVPDDLGHPSLLFGEIKAREWRPKNRQDNGLKAFEILERYV